MITDFQTILLRTSNLLKGLSNLICSPDQFGRERRRLQELAIFQIVIFQPLTHSADVLVILFYVVLKLKL
jgi:hypothetical protein